jgi:3-methyladenine DNA glycosylase Mpg
MYSRIQQLEIAAGLKRLLTDSGFSIESIVEAGPNKIAAALGIDLYVAKIIFDAAKIFEKNRPRAQDTIMASAN